MHIDNARSAINSFSSDMREKDKAERVYLGVYGIWVCVKLNLPQHLSSCPSSIYRPRIGILGCCNLDHSFAGRQVTWSTQMTCVRGAGWRTRGVGINLARGKRGMKCVDNNI